MARQGFLKNVWPDLIVINKNNFFIQNSLHLAQFNVKNDQPTYTGTLLCHLKECSSTPASQPIEWLDYHGKTLLSTLFQV